MEKLARFGERLQDPLFKYFACGLNPKMIALQDHKHILSKLRQRGLKVNRSFQVGNKKANYDTVRVSFYLIKICARKLSLIINAGSAYNLNLVKIGYYKELSSVCLSS